MATNKKSIITATWLSEPPKRNPDIQAANIRFNEGQIEYDLYYKKSETQEWRIPDSSCFLDNIPDWLEEGMDIVVWSEDISTNKFRKNFDWIHVMPIDKWLDSDLYKELNPVSPLTAKLQTKKKKESIKKQISVIEANFAHLKTLFDGL